MKNMSEAKVGDLIKVQRRHDRNAVEIFRIEQVTKTLAKCGKGKAFRLNNGLMQGTGDSWNRIYGYLVSPEDAEQLLAKSKLANEILAAQHKIGRFVVTEDNLAAVKLLLAP